MIIIFSISVFLTSQTAFAQVDIILDCDGALTPAVPTGSRFAGCNLSQEVFPGAMLTPFPTTVPPASSGIPAAGLDWFDRDNSKTWTPVDDLHSEARATCPTANTGFVPPVRNGQHDGGDCPILDLDPPGSPTSLGIFRHPGSGFTADIVDCDLETGGSPSGFMTGGTFGFAIIPCQDSRPNAQITFFDSNLDGFWNDGEDIVLDFPNAAGQLGTFDVPMVVGRKFLDVDKTALVLAGTQSTSSWIIPTLVAAIGFGLVIARKI